MWPLQGSKFMLCIACLKEMGILHKRSFWRRKNMRVQGQWEAQWSACTIWMHIMKCTSRCTKLKTKLPWTESSQNTPPLFPFYFEAKVGRGHLVENCICPLHRSSQSLICARSTIGFSGRTTTFAERLLWEISDAFVDAELRGIEVTCIVMATGDNLA